MAISYEQLRTADLTSLSDAVDAWRNTPGHFDTIARSFGSTVTKGLNDSNWEGEAADEAINKFSTVEKQMKAASDEAKDIYALFKSALESFRAAKGELKKIEEFVHDDKYLTISTDGRVYCDTSKAPEGQEAALQKGYLDSVQECNQRIEAALKDADDADAALHWALTRDANGRNRGFNTTTATSISEAVKERTESIEQARAMVKLAQLGDGLTTAQLQHMNKVLARHEGDPLFNEKFATGLGAKGTLRFWAELADPKKDPYSRGPIEPDKERLAQLKALQGNLGRSLASATYSDSAAMRNWERSIIDLGSSPIDSSHAGNPYGFQVMSNLMREGKYDTGFLQAYGDELLKEDKRWSGSFSPDDFWMRNNEADLNFGAKDDRGQDPMTGFMQALGHNPEASSSFFADDKKFNYLASERDWPSDGTDGDTKGSAGYRSLSHALESATTGHAYDVGPGPDTPPHTKAQAELMTKIVQGISNPEDDFKLHKGMEKSFGQMAAEYMPDIHRALSGGKAGGDTLSDLYPAAGSLASFGEQDITRFMYELGQTTDGYRALNIGESLYTSGLMGYHLANPDAYGESKAETLKEISVGNSEVQGVLGLARQDSDIQKSAEEDAAFNKDMDKWKAWANTAANIGIGAGVSTAASPVAGAFAVAATEDLTGQMIDGLFPAPRDRSDEALFTSGKDWEKHKDSSLRAAQDSARAAAAAYPSDLTQAQRESAVRAGHFEGSSRAHDVLREYREARGKT